MININDTQKENATLVIKGLIRLALEQYRGDDYERAKHAFRNCTLEQMNQEYEASGKTRKEILDGYEQVNKAVDIAMEWVRQR